MEVALGGPLGAVAGESCALAEDERAARARHEAKVTVLSMVDVGVGVGVDGNGMGTCRLDGVRDGWSSTLNGGREGGTGDSLSLSLSLLFCLFGGGGECASAGTPFYACPPCSLPAPSSGKRPSERGSIGIFPSFFGGLSRCARSAAPWASLEAPSSSAVELQLLDSVMSHHIPLTRLAAGCSSDGHNTATVITSSLAVNSFSICLYHIPKKECPVDA